MISKVSNRLRLGACMCIACVAIGAMGVALAQQGAGEKLVQANDPAQITDAVMISSISVNGKSIECGLFVKPPAVVQPVTPFQADTDWLRQMTISLCNRTDRTIVYGGIILHFLDTGDCRSVPCVGATLQFGQIPAVDAYDGITGQPLKPENPQRSAINWKPGTTLVIHVSDYMPEIEAKLANYMPVTAVTRVNIHLGSFYFLDGMKWSLGRYGVPDPQHPGKFQYLAADYFPGARAHNWPPGYNR